MLEQSDEATGERTEVTLADGGYHLGRYKEKTSKKAYPGFGLSAEPLHFLHMCQPIDTGDGLSALGSSTPLCVGTGWSPMRPAVHRNNQAATGA